MTQNKMKIRKGDNVVVTTGKYKGTSGEVLRVIPEDRKIIVQGVNTVKRHTKPTQFDAGGIKTKELPIDVSNVSILDPKENKPTRVGYKTLSDGRKVRFAKLSGETMDS